MIRLAFLSTAHIHTKGFLQRVGNLDGVEASVIWDDVADRGRRYAESCGARFVDRLGDAVGDDAVDALVICAENTRHLPLLEAALPAGKPVMCEKPLVTTDADLARLRSLVDEHEPVLTHGYFMPHAAKFRAAKAALDRGDVGDLVLATFRNAHHAAYGRWFDGEDLRWFTAPDLAGGGALLDMGTHAVHLLRTICGPVTRVWATHANLAGVYPDVDDWGVIEMAFASGARGRAEAGWCFHGGHKGLELLGSDAALDAVAIMTAAYRSAETGTWQTL